MRTIGVILIFFLIILIAGASFGYGYATMEETGNPIWMFAGLAFGAVLLGVAYKFRPQQGTLKEIMDMVIGDLDDPVQRRIIMRIFLASIMHSILLSIVLFDDEPPISLISIADGLTGDEQQSLAILVMFALSLFWVMYECWRFYNIDEFWKRISQGPLALGGAVLFALMVLWRIAQEYLDAPEMAIETLYVVYWITVVVGMTKCYRDAR